MKTSLRLFGLPLLFVSLIHSVAQSGPEAANIASATTPPATTISTQTNSDTYVIGTEDVLSINVWKEPDITRTVPVRPDGKITLPLLGEIQAGGLTPRKLQDNITNGLSSYVASPEVTVIVEQVKSLKFNIVGEIMKPGSYSLSEPTTVLDAIAVGGGLRDFAKGRRIYVLRSNSDGTHSTLPFDYKQVIKGKKLTQNIALRPGDTVVIP